MSLEASGQIGGALVFSKWKGRPYVRSLVKPSNPKSPGQVGIRAMMRFLSQSWKENFDAFEGGWIDYAKLANVSPFNAYISHNMRSWREFRGIMPNPTLEPAATAITITLDVTPGQRYALVEATPSAATVLIGIAIFRALETITAINWNNCVAIIPTNTTDEVSWTDAPLAAGTYYWAAAALTSLRAIGAKSNVEEQEVT